VNRFGYNGSLPAVVSITAYGSLLISFSIAIHGSLSGEVARSLALLPTYFMARVLVFV